MKRRENSVLTVIIAICFLFVACGESTPKRSFDAKKKFTITGKLQGLENSKIVVKEFSSNPRAQLPNNGVVDTGMIDEAGNVLIEGEVEYPMLAMIEASNGNFIYIPLQPGNYTIEGNGERLNSAILRGNGSLGVLQFFNMMTNSGSSLNAAQQNIQKAQQQGVSQENLDAMLKQFGQVYLAHIGRIADYIDTSSSGLGIYLAAGMLDPAFSYEHIVAALNKMNQKLPGSKYISEMNARLAPLKSWIGREAPEIEQPSPSGEKLKLSQTRGKYVLLDFWASWCKPCRYENPNVVRMYNGIGEDKFTVFSVSLDRAKQNWVQAIAQDKLAWKWHVSDLGFWNSAPAKKYGVSSIPATFLLDPEGKVVAKDLRGFMLELKLEELMNKES